MTPLDRLDDPAPHARLLSNGRYSTLVTGAGTGWSAWSGLALTAWQGDRTEDADGVFIYLRDLDRGAAWSVGHQPARTTPMRYAASFADGRVTITRVEAEIEACLDICVAPDTDVEIRRLRLLNLATRPRRLEVTTYSEIVLNDRNAHAAHPAFSKLFVETEYVADAGVLLARRRPRGANERVAWMMHALQGDGRLEHETDRARFLGRGRTPARPLALGTALAGTVGSVLDPIFSLRRTVGLAPGERVELALVLGAADTRAAALALAGGRPDVFERAAEAESALLARLGIDAEQAEMFHELASVILYGHPACASDAGAIRRSRGRSRADLAGVGLSGWKPFVVVRGDGVRLQEVSAAHAFWRAKGLDVEVLAISDERGGAAVEGVIVRRPDDIPPDQLDLAQALAAAVISGPLRPPPAALPPARGAARVHFVPPPAPSAVPLRFDNGYGGFASDGQEYVIRATPPMPWVNVVANESFGFLASESGAGCTWSRNSRENRLTPWSNDPVSDPSREGVYVRDEEAGVFWGPIAGESRHGFGYSCWRQTGHDLEQELCAFVPRHDRAKLLRLRLTNRGARRRRLSVFSYAQLVLGGLSSRTVVTSFDADVRALLAENPLNGEFADGVVVAAALTPDDAVRFTADRSAFLGRNGTPERPAAVAEAETLDGAAGAGLDPCAALQVTLALEPGATTDCVFLLGEATDAAGARALVRRYRAPGAVDEALAEITRFWRDTLSAVRIETPSPALDVMVNGWLPYQDLSCRLWGRSAFYQSGGAFGFRDQLQDAAALVYLRPELTRAQILLHAAHQFVEGDVLHWWHPPTGRGTRTHFSDDLLWLPWIAAFYVETTGDRSVLDEPVGFVTTRPLAPGEDEAYLLPSRTDETASVYAHCCRALDRSLTRGAHGLPLMGTGDWNDGMNRVGREGRGESVWLGFFLYRVLGDFLPLCDARGDVARAERYRAYRSALATALEESGWDGAWYRRAYYDDGTPLGSAGDTECRIDAIAQAWAVISGAAPRERADRAMDAVERELIDEEAGLIRLLTPPFDRTPHDPGYIRGYVPGIRENGGQYTHGALWVVRALAELGRRERAVHLLERIGPVHHTRSAEAVAVYQVEPYVVAADIYGVAPHVGRGGWTWYTGSAGWMYRVALESVLGVTLAGDTLRIRPRIPDGWPGFRVSLRLPDGKTRYEIEVRNPDGDARAVIGAMPGTVTDGAACVSLVRDGGTHPVVVTLGAD